VPWYFAVAERDHDIQNPTSAEKIRALGEQLRLAPDSQVLDVACGKAGPALILAREFGCHITGVERAPEFAAAAREAVNLAGLQERIDIVEHDAAAYPLEPASYDVAMCLGASFVWDGLVGTLAALAPSARSGGHVVVGEPYWRSSLPAGVDAEGFASLEQTVRRFEDAGLSVTALISANDDDWDRYESLHWRAIEEWLTENPDDPDVSEIRQRHEGARRRYVEFQREALGWAIFAGRKP